LVLLAERTHFPRPWRGNEFEPQTRRFLWKPCKARMILAGRWGHAERRAFLVLLAERTHFPRPWRGNEFEPQTRRFLWKPCKARMITEGCATLKSFYILPFHLTKIRFYIIIILPIHIKRRKLND
jgi:hypothetical protein